MMQGSVTMWEYMGECMCLGADPSPYQLRASGLLIIPSGYGREGSLASDYIIFRLTASPACLNTSLHTLAEDSSPPQQ